MTMTEKEEDLFRQLVAASQILVTVSNNAATVLSEEFQDMITTPAANVQAVLDQCRVSPVAWDGVFREEDCVREHFTPDVPDRYRDGRRDTGVKLTHNPTGMKAQSYSSADVEENYRRALRGLRDTVERRFPAPRQDPLQ